MSILKIFFDIRDRFPSTDWIQKVTIGPRSSYRDMKPGAMTDQQRGYVYRLFAYHGGPLALDAVIGAAGSATMPRAADECELLVCILYLSLKATFGGQTCARSIQKTVSCVNPRTIERETAIRRWRQEDLADENSVRFQRAPN